MEENSLEWSFNETFKPIPFLYNEYRILLGFQFDSLWYLHVTFYNIVLNYYLFPTYSYKFSLIREPSTYPAFVKVRFLRDSSLFSEKGVYFNSKSQSVVLEIMPPDTLEGLRIVFYFNKNKLSEKPDILRKDLTSLLHKEYLTDVTLKCGSEVVKVHKAVLCARSPVLEAEFRTKEQTIITLAIDDMDYDVFHVWINFMYGKGIWILSIDFAYDLLGVAEKYQMKGLKEVCVEYLESILSPENAVELLEVASLYDNPLKRKVITCIAENLSKIQLSEEWYDFKSRNPTLALEVYEYAEKQKL